MNAAIRGTSDARLIAELDELRRREREGLPELLACLSEVERRRLHLDFAYPTLFDYCVGRLRYSEGAAARRVHSARAASRFPALYVMIRSGELSLTAISRLEPHLTTANFDSVVSHAAGRRQREIEALIVDLVVEREAAEPKKEPECPPPAAPEIPLFGEAAGPPPPSVSPPPRARDTVRLEAPGVVRFSFQANERLRRGLDRLKELLRRSCGSGRLEEILERVVDDFLARNDPARRPVAAFRPPRLRQTRRIPRWVKDRVWRRDDGRCAFVAPDGRRCGASDDPGNVRLLCRAHNLQGARRSFGAEVPGVAT